MNIVSIKLLGILLITINSLAFSYSVDKLIELNQKIVKDLSQVNFNDLKNEVKIAVIGDYVYPEAFKTIEINNLEIPDNGIDDDNNSYIDDYYGMDFVAGNGRRLSPARSGHENGIVSIIDSLVTNFSLEDKISVIPINITLSQYSYNDNYAKSLADAIDYARIRGASVISMSVGIKKYGKYDFLFIDNDYQKSYDYFQAAINRATAAGIILVGSTSNDELNDHFKEPQVPGNATGVISVANVDFTGKIQSAYGKNVNLAYYGTDIYVWEDIETGVIAQKGSSYATPLVALTIAMAKSIMPKISYSQDLIQKLESSCQKKIKSKRNIASKCIFSPQQFFDNLK